MAIHQTKLYELPVKFHITEISILTVILKYNFCDNHIVYQPLNVKRGAVRRRISIRAFAFTKMLKGRSIVENSPMNLTPFLHLTNQIHDKQ